MSPSEKSRSTVREARGLLTPGSPMPGSMHALKAWVG